MKKTALFTILLFSLFFLYAEIFEIRPVEESVFFGEPVKIVLNRYFKKPVQINFKKSTDKFSVISVETNEDKNQTVINVMALETGEKDIPELLLLDGNGDKHSVLAGTVHVKPNTKETDTELRDIKEPRKAYEKDYLPLYILAGIIVAILLFLIIRRIIKKCRKKKDEYEAVSRQSPYELVMDYYRRAERHLEKGDTEKFTDDVTIGIRIYLEKLTREPFLEMTTTEVRKNIRKCDIDSRLAEEIISLLMKGDRVKFADEVFPLEVYKEMLHDFSRFIQTLHSVIREDDSDIQKS
ncbi:MAG: hypothetical protein R6W70_01415 [bacterium]